MPMTDRKLTVFTPAYNRAHTLPRTYASLLRQENKSFVWLIVDDGSADNTAELVRDWQTRDNGFEIRYVHKKNGGMHTAHNTAYQHVDTELAVCIDSDDCLAEGAVDLILNKWEQVCHEGHAGIMALDADLEGNILGDPFPQELTRTTLTDYYANGGTGDKKLVYRTEVFNQYPPYPEFEGEKYVALSYKYRLIDQDYTLAVLNEVICNVEYQPDGHGRGMWKEYLRSPRGFAFFRRFQMEHSGSARELVKNCIHYVSSSILAGDRSFIRNSPRKLLTVLCIPAGWVLSRVVRRRAK